MFYTAVLALPHGFINFVDLFMLGFLSTEGAVKLFHRYLEVIKS